jgi:hypothetical protein
MNYTQLVNQIKSTLENDFPGFTSSDGSVFTGDEQIEGFVRKAEELIYNTVQLPAIRRNVLGNMLAGDKYIGLPTDFLSMFSFAVIKSDGDHSYLLNKDVSFVREAYPNQNNTGTPAHYAQFDQDTLIFGPTPDQNYEVEMHYYYYPASIVDVGTSWLGDNFESVLFYGVLIQAYIFMKGDQDLVTLYNNKYGEALGLLKTLGDGRDRQDAYRSGQLRIPIS